FISFQMFDESVIDPRLRPETELARTRPGNATKQPGIVDLSPVKFTRRGAVEVAKDKAARAEQKKVKEAQAIKDTETATNKRRAIAELEDQMLVDEDTRQLNAAKPTRGPILTKVPRPIADIADIEHIPGSEKKGYRFFMYVSLVTNSPI
ncbi:hypothetical protein BDZ97DRAFT_1661453, partial [Flammula alnicola]